MKSILCLGLAGWSLLSVVARAETVQLKATADIWLSDATEEERNSSAGKVSQIKLKTISEMGAFRFDVSPIKGKKVLSAKLAMRVAGKDMLRHIRVSTISQTWEEGTSSRDYGPANGATYNFANADAKKPWAFPMSQFCDVIMGNGNTITTYDEIQRGSDGWFTVELTPEIVYAMVAGSTDGIAALDGGTLLLNNNFIYSREQKGSEPYITVELGAPLTKAPAAPVVTAEPDLDHAKLDSGTIRVSIKETPDVFCWNLKLDDQPVDRWRVPYPRAVQETGLEQKHLTGRAKPSGTVTFNLEDLTPSKAYALKVVAVARGGAASAPVKLTVKASTALTGTPAAAAPSAPAGASEPLKAGDALKVWVVPGLVKIDPLTSESMHADLAGKGDGRSVNAVWNGKEITLHGAKGEYVSYQLVVHRNDKNALASGIKVVPGALKNGDSTIGGAEIELFRNWYAKPENGDQWYPAYNIPLDHGEAFEIPDPKPGLNEQANQTVLVDVYIPKTAKPGMYEGSIAVGPDGSQAGFPVRLKVHDFALPDKLSFWCEFNCYDIPRNHVEYHRLAHQNRCVFNPEKYSPRVAGAGKDLTLDWTKYDEDVGPLLSGEAFRNCRRAGVPTPVMYLPFIDYWPMRLNRTTYAYKGSWVTLQGHQLKRDDPAYTQALQELNEHYLTAPYIGDALSQDYKDGFVKAARLFVEHFKEKGWTQTEMQCFYGGKETHRIDYGSDIMWWRTDEPCHLENWMALQFFDNLWTKTMREMGADLTRWVARGDISYPQWQGRILDQVIQVQYGGMGAEPNNTRLRLLKLWTGSETRHYGGLGDERLSYTRAVSNILNLWLAGASSFLPWQVLGEDRNLDKNSGTSLFVQGDRFGRPVVADMRLKGFREGEQLVEYCALLAEKKNLKRPQIRAFIDKFMTLGVKRTSANLDNADAQQASELTAWQISELRRALAELIMK